MTYKKNSLGLHHTKHVFKCMIWKISKKKAMGLFWHPLPSPVVYIVEIARYN